MKKLIGVVIVFSICNILFAVSTVYDGTTVEVESLIGTGENQTMFVVDWESGLTPSHAWLYQYDGTKTVADAMDAISASSDFQWSQSVYVQYINYDDGMELNETVHLGWLSFWNKDSGSWALNNLGVYEQQLVTGSWSGVVADDYLDWGDIAPTVPQIPEPATMLLLAAGCFMVRRK